MKNLFVLLLILGFSVFASAQYNAPYSFINSMLAPDNSDAKELKKQGFRSLTIMGYEPDYDGDISETSFTDKHEKYNENGLLVYTAVEIKPLQTVPNNTYTYDDEGRVIKYTDLNTKMQESVFEFEYDKKIGLKNILYKGEGNYKWVDSMGLLIAITELDTQHYYFDKKEVRLTKHVRVFREKGYANGFYYVDTTYYTYSKDNNLTKYKFVQIDKFKDTAVLETGEYSYDKKERLTKVLQKKYNYSYKAGSIPEIVETYDFSYGKKDGKLFDATYSREKFYSMGGEILSDINSATIQYTRNENKIITKATRSFNPGTVEALQYEYSK